MNADFDWKSWLENDNNVMFEDERSVGLATHEYPGVFTVHWFFEKRGRDAIKLAREMIGEMFEKYGAELVRGLTPCDNKAARWATRMVGLTSYGLVETTIGPHELFCMTKNEFYNGRKKD